MTTATRPRTKNVLAELRRLEKSLENANREAADLAGRQWEAVCELRGTPGHDDHARSLLSRLNRLREHTDPEAFNADGTAKDKTSPAGQLVAEVDAKLKLANELEPKIAHARNIADRRRRTHEDFVRENLAEIVVARRAGGEEASARVNQAAAMLADAIGQWLNEYGAIHDLCALAYRKDAAALTRAIPARDAASSLLHVAQGVDLPAPTISNETLRKHA